MDTEDFGIDMEALVRTFLAESGENLDQMEDALLALEGRPGDAELVNTVFRKAHSLKGDAGCVGFAVVSEFAHVLEDVLDRVRRGTLAVTSPLVTTLLAATDTLRALIPAAAAGREALNDEERQTLDVVRATALDPRAAGDSPRPGPAPSASNLERRSDSLRVETGRLDQMLDLTGELAIARGRLRQILESTGESAALEAFLESDRIFLDLQELVMRARMVPVGPWFRQQARVVRDLAAAAGCRATLAVEGAEVEVDNKLLEQMRQPLTHMLRNALHHGIEPPAERIAAGKEPVGVVTLRASQEAGSILIEIADDGRGIDREALAARAVAAGIVPEGQKLDERELLELVFRPGMSTAREVTESAGRGVGMDVVRRNVEQLHGSVHVESRSGEGTTITVRLPLTLAIIDGFAVAAGGERYIVPHEFVVECLELPADRSERGPAGVLSLRGEPLPYVRLATVFGLADSGGVRENVLIVECKGLRAGLAVDALEGQLQVVIKPMSKLLGGLRMIAGSAILGDGRVALILDVPSFIDQVLHEERVA